MACRNYLSVAAITLTGALLGVTQGTTAQQSLQHPGQVLLVDKAGNRPIELDIKAWPESKETGKQGDCPLFGKAPLDATRSEGKEGHFRLKVDARNRTYTTTYCGSGIFPRADPDIVNVRDGTTVVPMPVEVYARDYDRAAYQAALEQKIVRLIGLLNDLSYYQRVNADGFEGTMKQYSFTSDSKRAGRGLWPSLSARKSLCPGTRWKKASAHHQPARRTDERGGARPEAADVVFYLARLLLARSRLFRQHRLWAVLSRPVERRVGRRRC